MADVGLTIGTAAGLLVVLTLVAVFIALPLGRLGQDRCKPETEPIEAPPWAGRYVRHGTTVVTLTPSTVDQVAKNVLTQVRATGISMVGESASIGWRGRWGILNHGQREVALCWESTAEGRFRVTCWSRPRYKSELLDFGLSKQLVKSMLSCVVAQQPQTQR